MTGGTIDNSAHKNANPGSASGTGTFKNGGTTFTFLKGNGGAVFVENGNATMSGGTIKNCADFSRQSGVGDGGGAFYVNGGSFTMTGGTIDNCYGHNGGAVLVKNGTVTIEGNETNQPTIKNCSSRDGGGIMAWGKDTTTTIKNAIIQGNSTNGSGGGVYAYGGSEITISSGSISGNKAGNMGGGIATSGGKITVEGTGDISTNEAKNGGGVGVVEGEITITGGLIYSNIATGTFSGTTTKTGRDSVAGVGGGVYVYGTTSKASTFTLSGTNIGIYGNTASTAAADVYAYGEVTTLTIPGVDSMELTGMEGKQPTGWFADYMKDDASYPKTDLDGHENPGRYDYQNGTSNVAVSAEKLKNSKVFWCLTLGVEYTGKEGSLKITKKLKEPAKEEQTFLFTVTGTSTVGGTKAYSTTIPIVIGKGATEKSVTIQNLPDGNYTITETAWSWTYQEESYHIYSSDNQSASAAAKTFTVGVMAQNWVAEFTNKHSEDKWLSGDAIARNEWKSGQVTNTKKGS